LGDSFEIIIYVSHVGQFAQINGLAIDSNHRLQPDYMTDKLVLTVMARCLADFDGDGDVDQEDCNTFQGCSSLSKAVHQAHQLRMTAARSASKLISMTTAMSIRVILVCFSGVIVAKGARLIRIVRIKKMCSSPPLFYLF